MQNRARLDGRARDDFGLHLFNSVAEFVVVEIHACAIAAEEAVVQENDFFAPDFEEGFAPLVIHAPEVSVAHFVEAVGEEDYLVALKDTVPSRVADPDAVYITAYVIAVPEDLTVGNAENDIVPYANGPVVPVNNMAYGTRMYNMAVAAAVVTAKISGTAIVMSAVMSAVIVSDTAAGAVVSVMVST